MKKVSSEWKLPKEAGGFTLRGYSRAGKATGFYVPELNWYLDAGYADVTRENPRPDIIFITHGHADHSFLLPYLWLSEQPTIVYVPEQLVKYIRQYATSAAQLNNTQDDIRESDPSQSLVVNGVIHEQSFFLKGKREIQITCVQCYHKVPSIGYCFSEIKQKLKEEYKNLAPKEIGQLKRQGVEISTSVITPAFVFLGDTTIDVFENHPVLFKYPAIIVECTLLMEDRIEVATEGGHMHWKQLQKYVVENPQTTFVLIHFSVRYKSIKILEFFDAIMNDPIQPLKNLIICLERK